MDAYRPYMTPPAPPPPPPPSSMDPHYHQYQQQAAAPPRPPQGPWFPNQFHYNNPSQSGSAPPPPPWAPPPPPPPPPHHQSDHPPPPAYPAPPHPYPPHQAQQFPPRPYAPPPQHLNPYAPQDWNNPNWGYQQGWNHQAAQNDAEDWAARAKAWANAKASMESQHPQAHYQNQYPQAVESQSAENHQHSGSASAYQQYPHSAAPPHGPPVHLQENPSIGARPPSYLPDGRVAYSANDGTLGGDPNAVFHHQEHHRPVNQSAHQQEVPSSYSSVSGKGDNRDQNEKMLHLPSSAAQEGMGHLRAPMPAADGSVYSYGNQYTNPHANPADQPLEFTSRFNRDQDLLAQSVYAHHDSGGPLRGIDPVNMWTSSMTPDVAYPSIHAVLPSGPQHDPSITVPPPVSGRATPSFPRFPGPGFQPSISPPGGHFGMGAGPLMPPSGGFSADSYALPGSAGRPKKAPVPNWLREEIIKTKASITSSSLGHPKDEAQSVEDEGAYGSFEKDDQADSKSIDSSKSTEWEDDDEDYGEAAKTAAINQEIKRVLTEVLLKVTDELFDEIAMKVLNEDDHVAEDPMVSSTSHATAVTRTSTKATTLVENKGLENEDVSEKSSSSAGGNILGLATYISDDEDGEIQTSDVPNSSNSMKWDSKGPPADVYDAAENGTQRVEAEEQVSGQAKSDSGHPRTNLLESNDGGDSGNNKVNGAGNLTSLKVSPTGDQIHLNGKPVDGTGASFSKEIFEEDNKKSKLLDEKVSARKSALADTRDVETRLRPIVSEREDSKRTAAGDSSKGTETGHVKVDEDFGEDQRKDERHPRKEKAERHDSKETKDLGKHGEKRKEWEGRKRPANSDIKEDRKDRERLYRDNAKDDSRRSERSRDKGEDRSRHKGSHDLSRHKRRRSSSTGSRGLNSREDLATRGKYSSGEDSYDSRRKLQSRRCNLSPSPSPVRSRRRQVSRSPHSKHSQRRHSPYSSLEGSRERRRSRSRSPVRRHR